MSTTDIVTLDEIKKQLNMAASDPSQDDEITAFIESVTDVIEHIVGPVAIRTVTETHDGGGTALVLRQPPVRSVTSVTELGVAVDQSGWSLSSAGVLYRTGGPYQTDGIWPCGRGAVSVTYEAGRSPVPASIKQAAKELVAVNYRSQQGGNYSPFDRTGADTAPGGDVILGFFVPNRVRQLLAPHEQFAGIG